MTAGDVTNCNIGSNLNQEVEFYMPDTEKQTDTHNETSLCGYRK